MEPESRSKDAAITLTYLLAPQESMAKGKNARRIQAGAYLNSQEG